MQFGAGKPPVGIVFDCEFGSHPDDALAMALLYGLDGKNECRVASITISKPSLRAAAAAEVIGRFYAGAVSGNFNAIGRTLPIGLAADGGHAEDTEPIRAILDAKKYEHGIHSLNDTAEPHAVIRNALTAQFDQNAIVICLGRLSNLRLTLDLPGTKAWIERKSRYLVIAAGESDFAADVAAARKVFAEWPTEIIVAGADLAAALPFPATSIDKDFAWSPAHPVVDAFRGIGKPEVASLGMAAVLQAVRPGEKYFKLSDPGTVQIADNGAISLKPNAQGRHRNLSVDAGARDKVLEAYTALASAKPVVRAPRRPPQVQQQKKVPDK